MFSTSTDRLTTAHQIGKMLERFSPADRVRILDMARTLVSFQPGGIIRNLSTWSESALEQTARKCRPVRDT